MPEPRLRLRDVPAWIARRRELPFEERLEQASATFLGLPYQDDAVGEGRTGSFDRRPVFRFDKFDCHTYVETSLALASARSGREFRAIVLALRYRESKIGFATRNHLTSWQWIPHNIAAGLIRNVTVAVAGGEPARHEIRRFDMGMWFAQLRPARLRGFQDDDLPALRERLLRLKRAWTGPRWVAVEEPVLPFSAIFRAGEPFPGGAKVRGLQVNTPLLKRLPRGSILFLRSDSWSHLALALWHRGEWWVRHSSRGQERLVEVPLLLFLFNLSHFGKGHSLMVLEPLFSGR